MKKVKSQNKPITKQFRGQKSPSEKSFTNSGLKSSIALFIIILLGIIIYSNSFKCSFHLDDRNSIIDNYSIRDLTDIKAIWNHTSSRFIPYLSFAFNYQFGGLNEWGYHFVNLVIHLINSALVWWLTLLLFSSPSLKKQNISQHKKLIALITALLFVSHPLATQSVTYIVQRLASMVAMFYFLSILFYVKARLIDKNRLSKNLYITGAVISAILAMLSKQNAFTLPISIILVELCFFQEKKQLVNVKNNRFIVSILAITAVILYLYFEFSSTIFTPLPPSKGNPYTVTSVSYLFTQFSVIVTYIKLLILPINQNVDYDFPLSESLLEFRTLGSLLFLVSLVILAIYHYKKNRIISFGIFWFFITLSIESSIIPIEDLIFEHRTYLPSFGFFLLLSTLATQLLVYDYKYILYPTIVIIIGVNSVMTYNRNKIWKDELTLWNDIVTKSPQKARPYLNRGVAYSKINQWDNALSDFTKAVSLEPKYSYPSYLNLAIAQEKYSLWDEAITNYTKALKIYPEYYEAYSNRASAYGSLREWDKALADLAVAIKMNPNDPTNYYNRGTINMTNQKWQEAINDYSKAIEINPGYIDAYANRSIVFATIGQFEKSISDCSTIIGIDPNYLKAYNNRAITYSSMKKWNESIADYSIIVSNAPRNKNAIYNRGLAYLNSDQLDLAIADFSTVLELDPSNQSAFSNRQFAYDKQKKIK